MSAGAATQPSVPVQPSRAWWLVRIGTGMGLTFGVVMGLVTLLMTLAGDGPWSRRILVTVVVTVLGALLFGGTMAVVLGVVDVRQRRRHGLPFSPEVRQSGGTVVPVPIDAVGARAWQVMHQVGASPSWDPVIGELSVTTAPSWWSWGERVAVRLHDTSTPQGAATVVEVTSRPRMRTQLADYGTNQRHVRDVLAALTPPR